jgi:hypothetical protein
LADAKGISFILTKHSTKGTTSGAAAGIRLVELTLSGEYTDEALFERVLTKLTNGIRIYSEEDFQGEVLLLMKQELEAEQKVTAITKRALEMEISARWRAEAKLEEYKGLLGKLGEGLRTK